MTGVYLALRKTDAPGFMPRLFSRLTRGRLLTKYPHAGIVVHKDLYHITASRGMHMVYGFNSDGWDLFHVDVDATAVVKRYALNIKAKYDWVSLLAFVLPWRVSVRSWLYCYEWCYLAITGELPGKRVTPEDLLTFSKGAYGYKITEQDKPIQY